MSASGHRWTVLPNSATGFDASAGDSVFKPETYIKQGVTVSDVLELKESFDLLDCCGEGVLDVADAIDTMEGLGQPRLEQEPMIQALRAALRKGPTLDFQSFVSEMAPLLWAEEESKDSVRRAWRILDEGRRGHIRVDDLTGVVRKLELHISQEELRDMIAHADTNADGEVTFDDFYAAIVGGPDGGHPGVTRNTAGHL